MQMNGSDKGIPEVELGQHKGGLGYGIPEVPFPSLGGIGLKAGGWGGVRNARVFGLVQFIQVQL